MALIRRRRDATPRRSEVAVTRPNPWLAAAGENGPASEEPRRRCAWLHHGSDARGCPPRASHTEYKVAARSSPPDGRLASDCLDRAGAVDGPAPPASWWSSGAGPSTAIPPSKDHASGKRTVWQNLSLTPRVPYKGWGEGVTDLAMGRSRASPLTPPLSPQRAGRGSRPSLPLAVSTSIDVAGSSQ